MITWNDPESTFEAWKRCSKGRPCDYTGLTYEKLRGPTGIQWPCTPGAPDGTERLYSSATFNTDPDYCETYGYDLATGASRTPTEYPAQEPNGRAFLHAIPYEPPPEVPDEEYPVALTTGRVVYHFHTRTKTGRAPELDAAAPDVWVELNAKDAANASISDGDDVRIESRRGVMHARARIGGIRQGLAFVPFHYGPWRSPRQTDDASVSHAANELTIDLWDPVSKQPLFKIGAVRLSRLGGSS